MRKLSYLIRCDAQQRTRDDSLAAREGIPLCLDLFVKLGERTRLAHRAIEHVFKPFRNIRQRGEVCGIHPADGVEHHVA
ncbi:hypothetical protein SDC9_202977 [bioreactor metagenome]|uniref:Uncharacterized protein n=1 Tax=bioreactor metagenome TaxID=1076179 RepID=A0A645IV42_9ZZZZ